MPATAAEIPRWPGWHRPSGLRDARRRKRHQHCSRAFSHLTLMFAVREIHAARAPAKRAAR
jgi:hypothetical protein